MKIFSLKGWLSGADCAHVLSTLEAEAKGLIATNLKPAHEYAYSECQASLAYRIRPCLGKPKQAAKGDYTRRTMLRIPLKLT